MTRLTLICHAPTAATRAARFPDDEEAEPAQPSPSPAAARWLCGPERRARATAAALAGAAPVAIDADLGDWDCGRWRGLTLPEVGRDEPEALLSWMSDPASAPHGGESLLDLLARARRWMDGAAALGGRLAAVTHPAVLRAAVAAALEAGSACFWRLDAPPLCRARLSHDGRRWALQGLAPPRGRA